MTKRKHSDRDREDRKGVFHFPGTLDSRAANRDGAILLAQVPPDTRGLTARLLNDPLPDRSALDRKRAGVAA